MSSIRSYELSCAPDETSVFVEREILPGLLVDGYEVVERADTELELRAMRRPRWALALAVFLFPIGLVLLPVRRSRELRLLWRRGEVTLRVDGDDPRARHLIARLASEQERPPGFVELAALPFAAGAVPVLIAWIAAVQLIDARALFVAAIAGATVFGCGVGTLVGFRRASRSSDPRNPILWGTLPALAGALSAAAAFVLLILFLLAIGAGD
jgi:hypothetical protein